MRRRCWGRTIWPIAAACFVAVALALFGGGIGILPLAGLSVAAGVAVASVSPLWKRDLRRTPLFTYGMVVAHLGIAVSLAGMASDSGRLRRKRWSRHGLVSRNEWGRTVSVLNGITPVIGENWSGLRAELTATRGDSLLQLQPEARYFTDPPTGTSESAIATVWDGQLYTVLGAPDGQGRWQLRLWWKPFVTLIWGGGALVAIGGAFVASGPTAARAARGGAGGVGVRRWTLWLPLAVFVALIAVVAVQLYRPADRTVRSALVGEPMPTITLAPIAADRPGIVGTMFADGHPRVVNIFASWCVPCIAEAPQLMRLRQLGDRDRRGRGPRPARRHRRFPTAERQPLWRGSATIRWAASNCRWVRRGYPRAS